MVSGQEANSDYFGKMFSIPYTIIVCCVYSLESLHRGDSNEYAQHTN